MNQVKPLKNTTVTNAGRRRRSRAFWLLAVCAAVSLSAVRPMPAQDGGRPLTKEERIHELTMQECQLEAERARADMAMAKSEYEVTQKLFDEKLVAVDELNKARQTYEKAMLTFQSEIKLEKTRLEFLKENTFISVTEAKKFRTEEGAYKVSVTLRNDSDLNKARTTWART